MTPPINNQQYTTMSYIPSSSLMLTTTCDISGDRTKLRAGFWGRVICRKNDSGDSGAVSLRISKLKGMLETEGVNKTGILEKLT